jgi:hypothetical protein
VRGQLAVRIFDREILLVVAHDGHQDFFGKLEVGGLEVAEEHVRPLRQVGDGVDQRMVFAPACVGDCARHVVQRLANLVAAHFDVGQNVFAFELREVAVGRDDLERSPEERTRWP